MQPAPVQAPPRRRRWLLGFLALLIGVPLGYFLYLRYATQRDLDVLSAELDANDPGWRLEEMLASRKQIPDEQNSAVLVSKLVGKIGPFEAAIAAKPNLFDQLPAQARLNGEQLKLLRDSLGPMAEVRAEALRLQDMPEGRFLIQYSPDYLTTGVTALQRPRAVMQFLQFDAMLRAEEGDQAGAVAACRALLNTTRAINDEPSLIAQLIRFAGQAITVHSVERVLAQGEASEESLRALQELLEREQSEPHLLHAFRGERAGGDQMFRAMAAGKLQPSALAGGATGGWGSAIQDFFLRWQAGSHPAYLRVMTHAVEVSKLPEEKHLDALADFKETASRQPVLVRLIIPAAEKVAEAHGRNQAYLRSAIVAVAAERYRLRHRRWPEALPDLVKEGLLQAVPTDPYDGQTLRWRLLRDGAVVYSVGFDRTDNLGALDRNNWRNAGVDLGVRLWHAAARRQPPVKGTP